MLLTANIMALLSLCTALMAVYYLHRRKWINVVNTPNRVGNLDGLRGYLAFAVLITHFHIWYYYNQGVAWRYEALVPYAHDDVLFLGGFEAVSVFFMITGVLFYKRIVKKNNVHDWIRFFVSRFFRLAPIMWLAVLLLASIAALQKHQDNHTIFRNVIGVLEWMSFFRTPDIFDHKDTYIIIAGVSWTLQYEWIYYFSLPALALLYGGVRRVFSNKYVLIIATSLSYVLFIEILATQVIGRWGMEISYFVLFFLGMLAYEFAQREAVRKILCSQFVACIGLFALLVEISTASYAIWPLRYGLLFVAFAPVVAGNSYWGILRRSVSIAMGSITYCMYLLHGIVLYLFMNCYREMGQPKRLWFFLPLVSVLVVVMSTVAHYYIEEPGINWGRRLVKRLHNSDARNSVTCGTP